MRSILPGLWEIDEIGDRVHAYLWEWEGGVTLIDTGLPGAAPIILDALVAHGYPLHTVQRLIATHADLDHVGSLYQLKAATRAPVACHTVEKELLEHPERRLPAALYLRPFFWIMRRLPAGRRRPVTPDELMVDGQAMPEGFLVVHTPGHTPGHISLLHRKRRFLIAGDALHNRNGKLGMPPAVFTPDMTNAQRSVWKLAKKYGDDFDVVVFGHGPPILQNGGKRIKGFASRIFSAEV